MLVPITNALEPALMRNFWSKDIQQRARRPTPGWYWGKKKLLFALTWFPPPFCFHVCDSWSMYSHSDLKKNTKIKTTTRGPGKRCPAFLFFFPMPSDRRSFSSFGPRQNWENPCKFGCEFVGSLVPCVFFDVLNVVIIIDSFINHLEFAACDVARIQQLRTSHTSKFWRAHINLFIYFGGGGEGGRKCNHLVRNFPRISRGDSRTYFWN